MTDVLYLAWKYLAYHRWKTGVLIAAITLIVYLPIGLNLLVVESGKQLSSRADATPLLIGAKGSPLELALNALYFTSDAPPSMRYGEVVRVNEGGLATAIPVYSRFRSPQGRIVGTSLEYYEYRDLEIAKGRLMGMLGECVIGSAIAKEERLAPGDYVLSTPESVFDLAGVYPLKMRVVGVLRPTGGPDDHAIFVDVKTTWVIEGLAHGHQDLSAPDAASAVLRTEGDRIVANASVVQFNEITAENVASFHFHGDRNGFPVSSAIVVPKDEKSSALLQGRYLGEEELVQVVRPGEVIRELLATILTVRRYILIAVALSGVATLATMILVFALSLQLRRREIETILKIGGSRRRVVALVATEICGVLLAGAALAGILALATYQAADWVTRLAIQMS